MCGLNITGSECNELPDEKHWGERCKTSGDDCTLPALPFKQRCD